MTELQSVKARIDVLFAEKRQVRALLGRLHAGGGGNRLRGGTRGFGDTNLRNRLRQQLVQMDEEIGRLRGRLEQLRSGEA